MKPIRDLDPNDRPREKLAKKGSQALSDRELVAAIIGSGMAGRDVFLVANDIVRLIHEQKHRITYADLAKVPGVGAAKACQLVAAFELARRYGMKEDGGAVKITRPEEVLPLVADLITKKQEYVVCITLNGAGEMIEKRTVTVGLLNHSPVHPREVFADAITDRAASVIIVHNHPSGSPEPSSQDIAISRQLAEAGTTLGILVTDHIIIAARGHVSLKERGVL
ncbi:MAG: DNA repair protein RadC [Methanomicrobiales archaeon]|nr:DNA repair protein RadC [Methanomicrobiales archaeon]